MKTHAHKTLFPLFLLSLILLSPLPSLRRQQAYGGAPDGLSAPELENEYSSKNTSSISPPVLKWSQGGCYSSWCETGWYSSPAVADLDGDGKVEVIGAAYSIVVLDGESGALRWRVSSGHDLNEPGASNAGRTWPDVALADLQGDGDLEIVTAHHNGVLSVYSHEGYFEPGWPQQPAPGSELRSLGVADLDGDGDLEILTAATRSQDQWFVFEHTGVLRSGSWPQHNPDSDTNGYTSGAYNQNLAAGDLDGDGRAEILGPNDTHYVAAFEDDGRQIRASTLYGLNGDGTAKVWSRVGVHVEHSVDLRGWANCGSEHRPNFAHSAPLIVDVNYDGKLEGVVVGNVYNCGANPYASLYEMPYILNGDRTRWKSRPFDWNVLPEPLPDSGPLSEDWNKIESSHPNPVAADLNGDGTLEILFPSYDGRLHVYGLNKSQPGGWPYSVYNPDEGIYRFASEPAVADLDGDGLAEVIFTSWTEKGSGRSGKLHVLNYLGVPLQEISLPPPPSGQTWNGALAAPTLADIDGDPDLEVVVNTAHSGFVAYDLPGTEKAVILWGTGRGSYLRSGALEQGNLFASQLRVDRLMAQPGERLAYTLTLSNPGPALSGVSVNAPLPAGTQFGGNLQASEGSIEESGGVIQWSGDVSPGSPVILEWDAVLEASYTAGEVVARVEIQSGAGPALERRVVTWVNSRALYLPLLAAP